MIQADHVTPMDVELLDGGEDRDDVRRMDHTTPMDTEPPGGGGGEVRMVQLQQSLGGGDVHGSLLQAGVTVRLDQTKSGGADARMDGGEVPLVDHMEVEQERTKMLEPETKLKTKQGTIKAYLITKPPLEGKVHLGNHVLDGPMGHLDGIEKEGSAPTLSLEPKEKLGPLLRADLSTRMKAGRAKLRGRGAKSGTGKRGKKIWGRETDSSQPGIVAIFKKIEANLKVDSHGIYKFPLKTD